MKQPFISIVSPVYKAEQIVDELVHKIIESVTNITNDYEIILVEDGGLDHSWEKIEQNCLSTNKVKGIKLSRNFGQHYAITAGIEAARGDYVIIMDCDLQDDPKSISLIVHKLQEGYDVVFTKRIKRNHTIFKKYMSNLYNLILSIIGEKNFIIDTGSMLGASKLACASFIKQKQKYRLYVQMFKWIGFKNCYIEVPHNIRLIGNSSYTFVKMLMLGIQGVTSHSNKLLRISIYTGFAISFMSFLAGLTIISLFLTINFYPGWPSLFVVISFATGLILMSNGIVGIYIGKIFEQVKDRPLYIIEKKIN